MLVITLTFTSVPLFYFSFRKKMKLISQVIMQHLLRIFNFFLVHIKHKKAICFSSRKLLKIFLWLSTLTKQIVVVASICKVWVFGNWLAKHEKDPISFDFSMMSLLYYLLIHLLINFTSDMSLLATKKKLKKLTIRYDLKMVYVMQKQKAIILAAILIFCKKWTYNIIRVHFKSHIRFQCIIWP